MGLFHGFDASIPPRDAPAGYQAALGYLGGTRADPANTPHVWTLAEWLRFAHLAQAGIYALNSSLGGLAQGIAAASSARRLGWRSHAPHRRIIWLDAEDWVNLPLVEDACTGVWENGYLPGIYGSLSSVVAYTELGRPLWIAAWNGMPTIPPLPDVGGHQYRANVPYQGTAIDLSVFDSSMARHFGHGPRHELAA